MSTRRFYVEFWRKPCDYRSMFVDIGTGFTGQRVLLTGPSLANIATQVAALPSPDNATTNSGFGGGWTAIGFPVQDCAGNFSQWYVNYIQYPNYFKFFLPPPYGVGVSPAWGGNR
jgi:hypothetical protein